MSTEPPPASMPRVLVIGGYGLIGSAIARAALAQGYDVGALGRNRATAQRVLPQAHWHIADLRDLTTPQSWAQIVKGWDVVVNAAGALQDGPNDHLETVHHTAPAALFNVCSRAGIRVIQISAVGAVSDATTTFMRSKSRGDQALRNAGVDHHILRPGLVLADTAYGGTALLRILAAVPWVQPLALPDAQVQTTGIGELTTAVLKAIDRQLPVNATLDLVGPAPQSLREIVEQMRQWLGFQPARVTFVVPSIATCAVTWIADGLGYLGWRSPLRSNAVAVLRDGVLGDPTAAQSAGLFCAPTNQTLRQLPPAGAEHRLHARMALLMPTVITVLVAFWMVSGVIGLIAIEPAAQVLIQAGWGRAPAKFAVGFWALIDILLALALLWRPSAKIALVGMIAVPLIYLGAASVVSPWLWADPLGPLVKAVPAVALACVGLPMVQSR